MSSHGVLHYDGKTWSLKSLPRGATGWTALCDALVRLGRRAEAEARAASFRARYPTSTHGVRIQGLLSGPRP